jgi:hypothetical protein
MSFTTIYKIRCYIFLVIITIFGIMSCKKGGTPAPNKQVKKTGTEVYVVGDIYTTNQVSIATYWKNGIATELVNDTTKNSTATGIIVSDTDVYICGMINNVATYWKNGIAHSLAGGISTLAITISGSDIYVTGITYANGNTSAAYWKNGVLVNLSDNAKYVFPTTIAVNGNDVYVAGTSFTPIIMAVENLVYWKNGIETILGPTLSQPELYSAGTISMALNGSDIYITGSANTGSTYHTQCTYWKNGKLNMLTNVSTSAAANAIIANKGNIYIAGYSNGVAAYWENDVEHDFSDPSSQYAATAITFNGNDMYIAGYSGYNTSNAVYWKNGSLITLSTHSSITSGIGVVQY